VKVRYFNDTDTLYIELRADLMMYTRDLDENTLLEFDSAGSFFAMTVEHASRRTDIKYFSFERIAA
jgi:uncharacterized protein YuzE